MLAEKTPNVDKPHSVRLLKAGRTPLLPERAATHDTVERPTCQISIVPHPGRPGGFRILRCGPHRMDRPVPVHDHYDRSTVVSRT